MIYDYDAHPEDHRSGIDQADLQSLPDAEVEYVNAKTFLQKCSALTGDNLYDHLTDVLNKILAERPENVIDFFEEYSRKIKEQRFRPQSDHLEDIYVSPARYAVAKKLMPLLKPPVSEGPAMDPEDEELADMSRNDMLQLCYFLEQAGLGLPRNEMFYILLSMRNLIRKQPIASIKFWGKIHGSYKNYYVIETELKEEEYTRRNEVFEEPVSEIQPDPGGGGDDVATALENIAETQEEEGEGGPKPQSKVPRQLPPMPQAVYEEPPEPPSEPSGVGCNRKVYYVCNEPGDEWTQLPDVTPKHIRVARLITKSMTGFLNQEILTYPDFPGNESNYLRAQIARISAGTQISPLGFYTFKEEEGEEEEEEEEEEEAPAGDGGMKTNYRENSRFEPIPLRDMTDGSMSFWVHSTLHILPQGRTSWWNPNPASEEMDEELGEEEGGQPGVAGAEPETGPPLLTPLSEDASLEAVPPWSVRLSSKLVQDYAIAIVRSNLWPGAYCFANQGKIFHNIYLGFAQKYTSHNFSPMPLPPVEQDYPLGPEIMEVTDPTGAEEEKWRIDHLPKPPPIKPTGEEEMPEEEEEEEEEDD